MSDVVDAAVRALNSRLAGASVPGVVKFVIENEGTVMIDENGAAAEDGPADCTMRASVDTFRGLIEGEVNPTAAFMTGRLKVEGDMGLAMRLGSMLG